MSANKARKMRRQNKLLKRYTNRRLFWRNFRFFIFYLILLGVIGFGFYFVYTYLEDVLTLYESAQPKYVAEEVAKVFKDHDYETLYEYEDVSKMSFQSKEDYVTYLRSLTDGTYIDYHEVPSKDTNVKRYTVTSNGKSFASFTIQKTGETVNCGFLGEAIDLYEKGSISTDILQPITYSVTIPEGGKLLVNGDEISTDFIVKSDIETFVKGHLPESVNAPESLCTYQFVYSLGIPTIEAYDKQNNSIALQETAQDTYAFTFEYEDEIMRPKYEENILEVAEMFCKMTTKNANYKDVRAFMKPSSNADQYILNMDRTWLVKADKYAFNNVVTENYVSFSDSFFSCEVRFDFYTVSNKKENTYPWAARFFLEKVNDKWLVIDIEFME